MSGRRSAWKNLPDGTTVRRKPVQGQWCPRPLELLESSAYRILSRAAHMVLSRIEVEMRHHGGRDNGKLPVKFDNFVEYGLHRHAIAPAIRELEAVGIIRVPKRGRAGNGEYRSPNEFFLTYVSGRDAKGLPPHDWKVVKTMEEAEALARAARAAKNDMVAERVRSHWRRRKAHRNALPEKQKSSDGFCQNPVTVSITENGFFR